MSKVGDLVLAWGKEGRLTLGMPKLPREGYQDIAAIGNAVVEPQRVAWQVDIEKYYSKLWMSIK